MTFPLVFFFGSLISARCCRRSLLLCLLFYSRIDRKTEKHYWTALKGHEGEGSLHKLLHGRGWVSSLSAGSMVSGIDFQLFRLSLSLTEEGERHTDEIIELCHRFIALLRAEPPRKRIQVCGAVERRLLVYF